MLRIYPTPDGTDEFQWRRRFAGLVARRMEEFGQIPAQAAGSARDGVIAEWRAKFGEDAFPFRIQLQTDSPLSDLPGGVQTDDGRIWLTAAYVEESERTSFPEDERLTHSTLSDLARNYDPEFRAASLTIPTGQGSSHVTGRLNPVRAGRIDAASSDGQHLWILVDPQGLNLEFSILSGLENRSISWFERLPDLETPGPYLDHVAILAPGEQPGQAGHIPLHNFADMRARVETQLFGPEVANEHAATRSLEGVEVRRRDYSFSPITTTREENAMSEEAPAAETSEAAEPQERTADETTTRNLPATNSRGEDTGADTRLRTLETRVDALDSQNTELREMNKSLMSVIERMESDQNQAERRHLIGLIDNGLQGLVTEGHLRPGDFDRTRSLFIDEDGQPLLDEKQAMAWMEQLQRSAKSGPQHRTLLAFDELIAETGVPVVSRSIAGIAEQNGGLGERELAVQKLRDHVEGVKGAEKISSQNYPRYRQLLTAFAQGADVDDLIQKEAN